MNKKPNNTRTSSRSQREVSMVPTKILNWGNLFMERKGRKTRKTRIEEKFAPSVKRDKEDKTIIKSKIFQ